MATHFCVLAWETPQARTRSLAGYSPLAAPEQLTPLGAYWGAPSGSQGGGQAQGRANIRPGQAPRLPTSPVPAACR